MTTLRPALHDDGSGRTIIEVYGPNRTLLGCIYPYADGIKFISKYTKEIYEQNEARYAMGSKAVSLIIKVTPDDAAR